MFSILREGQLVSFRKDESGVDIENICIVHIRLSYMQSFESVPENRANVSSSQATSSSCCTSPQLVE